MMGLGCVAFNPKAKARDEIARLIAEFFARGGRITHCPGFGEGKIEREHPRAKLEFSATAHVEGGKSAKRAGVRTLQYELRSNFDFDQRREIRARFLDGETAPEIARTFNVPPARINIVLDQAQLRQEASPRQARLQEVAR